MKKIKLSAKGQKMLNKVLELENDKEFMANMVLYDENIKAIRSEAGSYEKDKALYTHDGKTEIGRWTVKTQERTALDVSAIMKGAPDVCVAYMKTVPETYTLKMANRATMEKVEVEERGRE